MAKESTESKLRRLRKEIAARGKQADKGQLVKGKAVFKAIRTRSELRKRILAIAPPPDWLVKSQEHAKRTGLDKLTMKEIDAEIAAARRERRSRKPD